MDHECNTTKGSLHEEKPTLRRWSNCFGLVNRFRRLKNRFSLAQPNTDYAQQNSTRSHVYPQHQFQRHHSATTIATDSPYISSNETIEHDNRSPTTAYHLSLSNTPTSSLSPPPRHSHHHFGRADYALHDVSGYCQRECQPLNTSTCHRAQKMTLRLSLDTESYDQQQYSNSNSNNSVTDSCVDVASMTDSLRIYHGADLGSTLHAESNSSTISNYSSLVTDARPAPPCRSGTLGQYKTIKDETSLPPPLPSASTSSTSSSSNLTSIDIPLKERRRRRSPLMFADNDKLTLPIPRNDIINIQYSNNSSMNSKQTTGLGPSSATAAGSVVRALTPNSDDYNAILKSREKAMQQLEGIQKATGKVVSMARIAPTRLLDEQLKTDDNDTSALVLQQQQQQQQRTVTPTITPTGPLLTSTTTDSSNNDKTVVIPAFLPTPSSFPPPQHHHPSPSVYLPSTPNSMNSSYL
ncbi:hypothetical protein BCR42DRAFT_450167 [Absidia repens]|uniref:Uncharacterized protein n=1 Tax=Absidia repens TaxID=90262 RepID=A0A1X2IMN2_9FUNG|nr:hypothetical protein BCR42DRAFT_450167 [Absidia repens]